MYERADLSNGAGVRAGLHDVKAFAVRTGARRVYGRRDPSTGAMRYSTYPPTDVGRRQRLAELTREAGADRHRRVLALLRDVRKPARGK